MRDRATTWLALLGDAKHEAALYAFDDPLRQRWNFMHGSAIAPGLPLEQMSSAQKDAALGLLASGLNVDGLEKAENIMLQQDILRDELRKGSPDRNRERFSLVIFGEPSDGPWGWRFEGHHLSLSYTLIGDRVISVTPSSFSSEPNTVPSGPHQGLVVLRDEEALGRTLFASLSGAARDAAILQTQSFGNILTIAGREDRLDRPQGLTVGDLAAPQRDLIARMMSVYCVDHLPRDLAEEQSARLREEQFEALRFGWAGENEPDKSIYYRLHGENLLIEFATLRDQPQHLHTIRHDLGRNFGSSKT